METKQQQQFVQKEMLQQQQKLIPPPVAVSKKDTSKLMIGLEWHGNKDVRVVDRPRPMLTESRDVLLRVTTTTICGSDLHLYHNEFAGMQKGDLLGHEFMGIIEQVGPDVKNFKAGDRVVVGFPIVCGECEFCLKKKFTCCERTNPNKEMETNYGHHIAGVFGYSHLLGGFEGGQAEYVRVPLADNSCLKVPDSLTEEQVLFLSDIACTGWHANVLGNVSEGQTIAVWGCGPVGLMAMMWAKFRGVKRIIAIDNVPFRLQMAKDKFGADIINFSQDDVVKTCQKWVPSGFDVCIDAAGFRYTKSLVEKLERALHLESDQATVLNEMIFLCKKGGIISLVADYYAYTNHFNIGALMEKSLTMTGGQSPVQAYWQELLQYIEQGKVDPTFVITHRWPLEKASEAYKMFDEKSDNCVKVILKPSSKPSAT